MIRYSLRCDRNHAFDSWFQSAEAYEKLAAAGLVSCAICGSTQVEKTLMAPAVRPARRTPARPDASQSDASQPDTSPAGAAPGATAPAPSATAARPLARPSGEIEEKLRALRAEIEASTDDVGTAFAREARAMHEGRTPERAIRGVARLDEARQLLEDGIPVLPLPFIPTRKTN
ncbi:DUF1178 family protein [Phaeovulum vinaykumarii]|uniref:DUF1178 family protein n=1 Tax=Phaeovulum vinaykumarii TaxID=407234 RepID=A0A1N7LJJ0_9RHOB|nr:DUF1178 family protein [Phaeovulum vinaykumarii]SIS73921.1 hypothetical protein SAMN05421795_103120 [Phaeovulum vinaykumarii]SOC04822.1 hypothetical protein SAMN05878426_103120 [Phaeovulum vinaykumarii]